MAQRLCMGGKQTIKLTEVEVGRDWPSEFCRQYKIHGWQRTESYFWRERRLKGSVYRPDQTSNSGNRFYNCSFYLNLVWISAQRNLVHSLDFAEVYTAKKRTPHEIIHHVGVLPAVIRWKQEKMNHGHSIVYSIFTTPMIDTEEWNYEPLPNYYWNCPNSHILLSLRDLRFHRTCLNRQGNLHKNALQQLSQLRAMLMGTLAPCCLLPWACIFADFLSCAFEESRS